MVSLANLAIALLVWSNYSFLQGILGDCAKDCKINVLETIPPGLDFGSANINHVPTIEGWKRLIAEAKNTIEIGSSYWTLRNSNFTHVGSEKGNEIFKLLKDAGLNRGIKIRITQDAQSETSVAPNLDTKELAESGAAEVRSLNFTRLIGSGILHTKMWVVDRKHVYIGSANFDWRALTHVKELGMLITNCSCVGEDFGKAFDVYWKLGELGAKVPKRWDPSYEPGAGKNKPYKVDFNETTYNAYISSSPPALCPKSRTTDLDSILDIIDNAQKFIHIEVMDYFPLILYNKKIKYWATIDNHLRTAAIDRGVKVKLLVGKWKTTRRSTYNFLGSLQLMYKTYPWVDVQTKFFEIPSNPEEAKIPFARVNHNKFMVTDKSGYIGTSNWIGDYFLSTAGIGFIVSPTTNNPKGYYNQSSPGNPWRKQSLIHSNSNNNNNLGTKDLHSQILDIFERDWNSTYAKHIWSLDGMPFPQRPNEPSAASSKTTKIHFLLLLIFIFTYILV